MRLPTVIAEVGNSHDASLVREITWPVAEVAERGLTISLLAFRTTYR